VNKFLKLAWGIDWLLESSIVGFWLEFVQIIGWFDGIDGFLRSRFMWQRNLLVVVASGGWGSPESFTLVWQNGCTLLVVLRRVIRYIRIFIGVLKFE